MDYGDKPAAAKRSLLTPPRWSLFAPPLTRGIRVHVRGECGGAAFGHGGSIDALDEGLNACVHGLRRLHRSGIGVIVRQCIGFRSAVLPGSDAAFKVVVREKTEQERSAAKERDRDAPDVLAFLYPQLGPGYFGSRKNYRHSRFLTSVDEIEELTGLDFKLSPDSAVEKRLERRRATVLWEPSEVDLKQRRLFLSGCRN